MTAPKRRGVADDGIIVFFGDHGQPTTSATETRSSPPGARPDPSALTRLTSREREVLMLVAQGMTARETAGVLGISPRTVEQHKGRILAKLGVPNQAAAVAAALGHEAGARSGA